MNRQAIAFALSSAALFGLSTPAAKVLLGTVDPVVLAGLLYCGAGVGIAVLRRARPTISPGTGSSEAALAPGDAPWLGGAIVAGGVAGPLLLMVGLARTDAATASLLLTFEGVATALLAWFVFREHFDRRIALGMATLVVGAVILSWSGTPTLSNLAGPLADPLQIVELKGLIAGPVNLTIGLLGGGTLPDVATILLAGLVGLFGYGVSLVLFVLALRALGTARTAAYFSTAPFLGAIAAVFMLRDPLSLQLVAASILMALGVWLHFTEDHNHEHEHEPLEHAHRHVHDEHHRHAHVPDDPPGEPHTHWHSHERLRHKHPHTPDMHHTHKH